jgi:hypothetical protein
MQDGTVHPGCMQTNSVNPFGAWLRLQRSAAHLSKRALARAVPGTQPPDIRDYERGRDPTPAKAYSLGRALESAFVQRYLTDDRQRIAAHGADVPLPEVVAGATNGLDALMAGGYVADVVGCLGEFVRGADLLTTEQYLCLADLLELATTGEILPGFMYPRLDEAANRWLSDPDQNRLPGRFAAAHDLLAKNGDLAVAVDILREWVPDELVAP